MRFPFAFLAFFLASQSHLIEARAVNISNVWILPQEGFPVFYRYFRDHISWYEADAVCQFHHGNLVTVDTTAQYDAVRAYLKEMDIASKAWIGLIKSNPEGDFTWTDYRPLSTDGYWGVSPDELQQGAPLCAATDPAADYRWKALGCGGPEIASFICELPVPSWALHQENGCMMHALPALTATFLPGSAAIQLTIDCGLAGVKNVTCTGNKSHQDLLKELSCGIPYEEFSESTALPTSTVFGEFYTNPSPTSSNSTTDQQQSLSTGVAINTKAISEEITSKDYGMLSPTDDIATSTTDKITTKEEINTMHAQYPTVSVVAYITTPQGTSMITLKPTLTSNNITESNSEIETDKIDLPVFIARHKYGSKTPNSTIFTQPSDHFIPPLVMAKSKASTDMAVVTEDEKHNQQADLKEKLQKKNNLDTAVLVKPTNSEMNLRSKSEYSTTTEHNDKDVPEDFSSSVTTTGESSVTDVTKKITEHTMKKTGNGKKYDREKENVKAKYNNGKLVIRKVEENVELNTSHPGQKADSTASVESKLLTSTFSTIHDLAEERPLFTSKGPTQNIETEINNLIDPNLNILNREKQINNESESIPYEIIHKQKSSTTGSSLFAEDLNSLESNKTNSLETTSTSGTVGEENFTNDARTDPKAKPNRSRVLTSSSHHTFYPYFINRVLG